MDYMPASLKSVALQYFCFFDGSGIFMYLSLCTEKPQKDGMWIMKPSDPSFVVIALQVRLSVENMDLGSREQRSFMLLVQRPS